MQREAEHRQETTKQVYARLKRFHEKQERDAIRNSPAHLGNLRRNRWGA